MKVAKEKLFSVRDIFGIPQAGGVKLRGYETPPPGREHLVPRATPWFVFRSDLMSRFVLFERLIERGRVRPGMWLKGPTGAGKTSFVLEVAARLNQPVQHVVFHRDMEYHDLLGTKTLIDGEVLFLPGPLVDAVRFGDWFVGDEVDLANPGVLTALNAILDGRPLVIAENGGEVVPIHPRFRMFLTANTGGGGDRTGLYQGTRPQNLALRNRCVAVEVDYLPAEVEQAILGRTTPELPGFIRERMVAAANAVRSKFIGRLGEADAALADGVSVVLSTRTLVAWAEVTLLSQPLAKALAARRLSVWEHALRFVLLDGIDDPVERTKVVELVQREMGGVEEMGAAGRKAAEAGA